MTFLGLPDRAWFWFAAAFYLAGLVLGTAAVLRDRRHSHFAIYGVLALGFLGQTIGLYLRGRATRGCPIGNLFEIFQFTAWSSTVLYLVVGTAFRVSLLGYFSSCLSAFLTIVSLGMPAWDPARPAAALGGMPWVAFHAALAVFSYGVFALLALTSVMYLLQTYSLKHKRLRGLFSFLPSILDLDHISLRLLIAGIVLMSWALGIGAVHWLHDLSSVDTPKLLTAFVWFAYGGVLALRLLGRLVSQRLAWACVALFMMALVCLGPVNASRHPVAPVAPASLKS